MDSIDRKLPGALISVPDVASQLFGGHADEKTGRVVSTESDRIRVRRMIEAGELPARQIGKRWYVRRTDLHAKINTATNVTR